MMQHTILRDSWRLSFWFLTPLAFMIWHTCTTYINKNNEVISTYHKYNLFSPHPLYHSAPCFPSLFPHLKGENVVNISSWLRREKRGRKVGYMGLRHKVFWWVVVKAMNMWSLYVWKQECMLTPTLEIGNQSCPVIISFTLCSVCHLRRAFP
jgi:hypothetical protein